MDLKRGKLNYDLAKKYLDDALNDGWTEEPRSKDQGLHILNRENYTLHICLFVSNENYQSHISAWGPDNLAIAISAPLYSWEDIVSGTRRCMCCMRDDVDTSRYSFAGRACKKCLPRMQEIHEYPGWCD